MSTSFLLFLFLFTLALTGIIVYFFWQSKQHFTWWNKVVELSTEDIQHSEDNIAVAIQGVVGASPVLYEPLNNEPTVWWRYRVEEQWKERNQNDESSMNKSRIISDEQTQDPFLLKGSSGSVIRISPFHYGVDIDKNAVQRYTHTERQSSNMSINIGNYYDDNHIIIHTVEFLKPGTMVTISGYTQSGTVVATDEEPIRVIKGNVEEKIISVGKRTKFLKISIALSSLINIGLFIALIINSLA